MRAMTLDQAVEHFGSQTALAKALGIEPPSVSEWKANGKIPSVRQFQIQVVTAGLLQADNIERVA